VKQEALRERLLIELDLLTADVTALTSPLSDAELGWRPPGDGWSIGQVLEHILTGGDRYLARLRPLIYMPGAPLARAEDRDWEPQFTASLLVSSLKAKRKLRAPRVLQVGAQPRPDARGAFIAQQAAIRALLLASADLDWNRLRFRSPVNRIIKLNLGDAFTVLVVHGQRHALQMQRVRGLPGFGRN